MVPLICQSVNSTFLYNRASRNSIFYSPVIFSNQLNILNTSYPEHLFDNSLSDLKYINNKYLSPDGSKQWLQLLDNPT